jgi:hypothetical protein
VTYLTALQNSSSLQLISSEGPQDIRFHQNKIFSLWSEAIITSLPSLNDIRCKCNFIGTDPSVVSDTLVEMFLNLNT